MKTDMCEPLKSDYFLTRRIRIIELKTVQHQKVICITVSVSLILGLQKVVGYLVRSNSR